MARSGNVTIKLGAREVQEVLGRPIIGRYSKTVLGKLYKAVATKFPDVKAELSDEDKAYQIQREVYETEEWMKFRAESQFKRDEINIQYRHLNEEEAMKFQGLFQARLDAVGIKGIQARGYGFVRVGDKL